MPDRKPAYKRSVRASVYGLWSGRTDIFTFIDSMISSMRIYYRQAWIEGAAECGIKADELTAEELQALEQEVNSDTLYLLGFARNIRDNDKLAGEKFTPHLKRAEIWVNRYASLRNKARLMACANKKLKWVMNPLKEHCSTCARLNGKVKRQSTWIESGLQPQNAPNLLLECEGWKCGCEFVVTDEPLTRGRLPGVP